MKLTKQYTHDFFQSPFNPKESYFDFWKRWNDDIDPTSLIPGSGSDHTPFQFHLGIPSIDIVFDSDTKKHPTLTGNDYPTYHTGFETFQLVDQIIDPGFKIHKSCAELNLGLAYDLANSKFLDFRPDNYAKVMKQAVKEMEHNGIFNRIRNLNLNPKYFIDAVNNFETISNAWIAKSSQISTNDFITMRRLNDQVIKIDQTLLLYEGLPGRPSLRHSIISPSKSNSYGSSIFPGIHDLLHVNNVTLLEKHLSDLMIVINGAAVFLKEDF